MKKIYLLTTLLFSAAWATAQFSVDPTNPFVISDATSIQEGVQQLPDGNGGYYVLWLDRRGDGTNKEIYGQHLDAVGVPQWTPNGKALVQPPGKSAAAFVLASFDGDFIVTWFTVNTSGYGDTMWVQRFNSTGNPVWTNPALVATRDGIIGIVNSGYNAWENDSGAFICYSVVYIGGSSGFQFNRVDFNGQIRWAPNSLAFTLSGYDYRGASDGLNGMYALSKGNGVGSQMFIMHFDLQGNPTWPTSVDFTAGGGVNGFAGRITMLADHDANYYCIWDGNNYNVLAAKMDSSGAMKWGPTNVVNTASVRYASSGRIIDNKLWAAWNDDRNGGSSVYVQCLDTAGNLLFSTDGAFAGTDNIYSIPKLAESDSGSVLVAFVSNDIQSMKVQRIRSDSTVTWPGGLIIGDPPTDAIVAGDLAVADDAGGCNAVFWSSQNSGDIYGAKVCSNGQLISVPEQLPANESLTVYPNPVQGSFDVANIHGSVERISIFNLLGEQVYSQSFAGNPQQLHIDAATLTPGVYLLEVQAGEKSRHVRFAKD